MISRLSVVVFIKRYGADDEPIIPIRYYLKERQDQAERIAGKECQSAVLRMKRNLSGLWPAVGRSSDRLWSIFENMRRAQSDLLY